MHQGGVRIIIRAMLIIAMAGSLTRSSNVKAEGQNDLVISKIQITGGSGKTSEDYVSIYNKSSAVVDLNGLRLVKRTKTGTTDTALKSWVSPTLLNPNSYYTWACSANDFATLINADTSSTQTISDDNGVALRLGAENSSTIIDSVGWGSASNIFVEGSPYPTNPGANEHLARINNSDTNNNATDFQIIKPIIPPVCGNNIVETGENCDDGNTSSLDGCSATCQLELSLSVCGNNILEAGEACDDGNTTSNDGCSSICQIENPSSILGDVRINELVSDPAGGDEWLELYNNSGRELDLTNWTIEDGSSTKTTLAGSIGNAATNKFFIITKPKGALNNTGDIIILKNSDGDVIDSITYGDWDDGDTTNNAPAATKPYALARLHDGESTATDSNDFKVTTKLTKGSANIINEPNNDNADINSSVAESGYDYSQDIIISEIFPNPVGLDSEAKSGEFVELYNKGDKNVLLNGWRLEIDGSIMEIPSATTIYAKQYSNLNTKNVLPLPNDGATVKLFQPERLTSYQSISYKKAIEGQSYANFLTSGWQWTIKPTPGESNILIQAPRASFDLMNEAMVNQTINFDSSDSFLADKNASYSWNFGDGQFSNLANPSHIFTESGKHTISLTIKTDYGLNTISKNINILKNIINNSDATQAENTIASINTDSKTTEEKTTPGKENSLTTVRGMAIVAPNTFGSQFFFFLPDHGEPLYEIYNNKKLFPKIKAGDRLEITGDYSEKESGPQLKTKLANDIKIIGQAEITKPELSQSSDLKLAPYPRLALVQGEVVSKKSPRVYLADQQGEIEVYLSTGSGLKISDFNIGDKVNIFGVLTTSKGVARLQPREKNDIEKVTMPDVKAASLEVTTPSQSETIDLTNKDTANKKTVLFYYLIAGGIIILAGAIYFVYKK